MWLLLQIKVFLMDTFSETCNKLSFPCNDATAMGNGYNCMKCQPSSWILIDSP